MGDNLENLRPALQSAAEQLAIELSDDQTNALLSYLGLLQRWNATYNLTAVRDPRQMLTQHLADCLAIIPPLRRHSGDRHLRLLDVGSGGGLPGVVIAIQSPSIDVTCVDTVGKKAAFIRQVAAELKLKNLHSEHARVEQVKAARFDIIASRAFASLADFTRLTRQLLGDGGVWLAMKGKLPTNELAELDDDIEVFHVEQLAVPTLDADRCLIWLRPRR